MCTKVECNTWELVSVAVVAVCILLHCQGLSNVHHANDPEVEYTRLPVN